MRRSKIFGDDSDNLREWGHTCQPASMVFRSLPKDPAITHICDKLNSNSSLTLGAHTFMLALAP